MMPKARWNPETGKRHTFAEDETPPANFLPCHPNDPAREAKTGQPAPKAPEPASDADMSGGMTKTELTDALKAGGMDVDAAANKATLTGQLIVALKAALTERGVAYEEDETAKSLLDKVAAPQG